MAFGYIKIQDSRGIRWFPVHEKSNLKLFLSILDCSWSIDLGTIYLVSCETCLGTQGVVSLLNYES